MLISANTGLHSANPSGVRYDMVEAVDFFADAGFESLDVNFCGTIPKNSTSAFLTARNRNGVQE